MISAAPGLLNVGYEHRADEEGRMETLVSLSHTSQDLWQRTAGSVGEEAVASISPIAPDATAAAFGAHESTSSSVTDQGYHADKDRFQKHTSTLLIIQHLVRQRNELMTIDKQLFDIMTQYLVQLDGLNQSSDCFLPSADLIQIDESSDNMSLHTHLEQQQHQQLLDTIDNERKLFSQQQQPQQQKPQWLNQNYGAPSALGLPHQYGYLASWYGSQAAELAGVIDLSLVGRNNSNISKEFETDERQLTSQDSSKESSPIPSAPSSAAVRDRAPSVNPKKTRLLGTSKAAADWSVGSSESESRPRTKAMATTATATTIEILPAPQKVENSTENISSFSCNSSQQPDQTSPMDPLTTKRLPSNNAANSNKHKKNDGHQIKLQFQQQQQSVMTDGCLVTNSKLANSPSKSALHVIINNSLTQKPLNNTLVARQDEDGDVDDAHDENMIGPLRKKFRSWPHVAYEQQNNHDPLMKYKGDIINTSTNTRNKMQASANFLEPNDNNIELVYALHQQRQQQLLFSQYLGQSQVESLSSAQLQLSTAAISDDHPMFNYHVNRVQFNSRASASNDSDYRANYLLLENRPHILDDSLARLAQNPHHQQNNSYNRFNTANNSRLHSTLSVAPAHRIALPHEHHHDAYSALPHQHDHCQQVRSGLQTAGEGSHQLIQARDIQLRPIAFRCHVCGSGFEDRHRLQQHLSIHLNLHPSWFEERTIKETMAQYESKRGDYLCTSCSVRFDTTAEFDRHMHSHDDKPHRCEFCNQDNKLVSFRYYRQLLTHLRSHCFLYSCRFAPDCKQTANRKDYLKLHILKHHLNNKLPEQYTFCCQ